MALAGIHQLFEEFSAEEKTFDGIYFTSEVTLSREAFLQQMEFISHRVETQLQPITS